MKINFSALASGILFEVKDSFIKKYLASGYILFFSLFFVLFLQLNPLTVFGQDDPQFSQNMYNRLPVNPAYAGSSGGMCATTLMRNQWVGFEGAPKSLNFAFDANVSPVHGGLGIVAVADKLGLNTTTSVKVSYAYRMRLFQNGRLAFGLDAGLIQKSIDLPSASPTVPDPLINGPVSGTAPDFSFGTYYNTSDFYIGASVTHINAASFDFKNATYTTRRHFYLMGGFNYALNRTLTFKPSLFLKSDATSTQLDINTTLLYNNTIWAGVSYRIDDAVALMAGMNITNELKFGYSYDITTSSIKISSNGSHELMLRYCFKIKDNRPTYRERTVRFL